MLLYFYSYLATSPPMEYLDSGITHASACLLFWDFFSWTSGIWSNLTKVSCSFGTFFQETPEFDPIWWKLPVALELFFKKSLSSIQFGESFLWLWNFFPEKPGFSPNLRRLPGAGVKSNVTVTIITTIFARINCLEDCPILQRQIRIWISKFPFPSFLLT